MIFSDITLSQKLERAEARACADFVEARRRLDPSHGSEWIDVDGVYAMYDGADSPCTQTFGLGLFTDPAHSQMRVLEDFFHSRGAPVLHEVSPMGKPAMLTILNERGYNPVEMSSVMYRLLEGRRSRGHAANPAIRTRIAGEDEADLWARISADGWGTEQEELADFMFDFAKVSVHCDGAFPCIAELDGKPIATAMLFVHDDIAMLAGASTLPEGRRKGAQTALLNARLELARERGCTLAAMGASPGSQSQKNAEKNGFNIAYSRMKWQLMN